MTSRGRVIQRKRDYSKEEGGFDAKGGENVHDMSALAPMRTSEASIFDDSIGNGDSSDSDVDYDRRNDKCTKNKTDNEDRNMKNRDYSDDSEDSGVFSDDSISGDRGRPRGPSRHYGDKESKVVIKDPVFHHPKDNAVEWGDGKRDPKKFPPKIDRSTSTASKTIAKSQGPVSKYTTNKSVVVDDSLLKSSRKDEPSNYDHLNISSNSSTASESSFGSSTGNGPLSVSAILTIDPEDPNFLSSIAYNRIIFYSKPGIGRSYKHATYVRADILNMASVMKAHKLQIMNSIKTTLRLCASHNRCAYDNVAKYKFKRLENFELMKNQYSFISESNKSEYHYDILKYGENFKGASTSQSSSSQSLTTSNSSLSSTLLLRRDQFQELHKNRAQEDIKVKVIGPGGQLHQRYNNSNSDTTRPSLWDGTEYKLKILRELDRKLFLKMVFESFLQYSKAIRSVKKFLEANEKRRSRVVFELCFLSIRLNTLMSRYIQTCAEVKLNKLLFRKYGRPMLLKLQVWASKQLQYADVFKKMTKLYLLRSKARALRRLALGRMTSKQNNALKDWIFRRNVIGRRLIYFMKWKNTFIYRNLNRLSLYNRLSKNSRLFTDINFETMDILGSDQLHSISMDFYRDTDRSLVIELGSIYQPSKINRILLLCKNDDFDRAVGKVAGNLKEFPSSSPTIFPSAFRLNNYKLRMVRAIIATSLARISRGDLYSRQMKALLGGMPPVSTLGRELVEKSTIVINKVMYARKSVTLPMTDVARNRGGNGDSKNMSTNYSNYYENNNNNNNNRGIVDGAANSINRGNKTRSSATNRRNRDEENYSEGSSSVGVGKKLGARRSRGNYSQLVNPYINRQNIIGVYLIDQALKLVRRTEVKVDITNEHDVAIELINRGIDSIRSWKYYAHVCISRRGAKAVHRRSELKFHLKSWKKAYRISKKNSDALIDQFNKKKVMHTFQKFKANTIASSNSKVAYLKRYVLNVGTITRLFAHWKKVFEESDFDRQLNHVVSKFIISKETEVKRKIFYSWNRMSTLSIAERRVTDHTQIKSKRHVLYLWKRKFCARRKLKKAFSIFKLCWDSWLEEENAKPSPFQVKHTLFHEWRSQTDESLALKRSQEDGMKALLFRGSSLMSIHFFQWKLFARSEIFERSQAERRTVMIHRMCFYNLACFAVQSRRRWTNFKDGVLQRTKKRTFYAWKLAILRDEILMPLQHYHMVLKRGNFKSWLLFCRMKKVTRIPMPSICLDYYVKPIFYNWIDLFNRRVRYKQGLKILDNIIGKRFAMRVALYKMPGRVEYKLAEEHRLSRMSNPHSKILVLSAIDQANADLKAPKKRWSKFDALLASKLKAADPRKRNQILKHAREATFDEEITHYDAEQIKSFIEFLPEPLRIRAANYQYFVVEGSSQEENTQRVYFIMSSMLRAWYRCMRNEQKLRMRERMVKVAQQKHIIYRSMKHWIQAVPRTCHRHFTWTQLRAFNPHMSYVEEAKVDEEAFNAKFTADESAKKNVIKELAKKEHDDFLNYTNGQGAYERASSYIAKNNF